jgi:hypothetical protein
MKLAITGKNGADSLGITVIGDLALRLVANGRA